MNINKIVYLNEQGIKDIIFKSSSVLLFNYDRIVSNNIELDLNKYHHSMMKELIENKIKDELYVKNKSDIIKNLNWLRENISNQINLDYLANIFIGFSPVPAKININLTQNYIFNATNFMHFIEKLLTEGINNIGLESDDDPLTHPHIKELLTTLRGNGFNIKLTTWGNSLLENTNLILRTVTHLKLKYNVVNETDKIPNQLQALGVISNKASLWKKPIKTHIDLVLNSFEPKLIIDYIRFSIEKKINRISFNISNIKVIDQKMKNILNSIIEQYTNQIQIYIDMEDGEINNFNRCYMPSIRWTLSDDNKVYACYKYGVLGGKDRENYKVCNMKEVGTSKYRKNLHDLLSNIEPEKCRHCAYGESEINRIMNNLYDLINANNYVNFIQQYWNLPISLIERENNVSRIELLINKRYEQKHQDLEKKFDRLFKGSKKEPIELKNLSVEISTNDRILREIYYAWHKMFSSDVAKLGRKIGEKFSLFNDADWVSNNVVTTDGKLENILPLLIEDSVIITDIEPYAFISREIPNVEFENCNNLFHISQISNGTDLNNIIKQISKSKIQYVLGIGGGRTMDYLKFISLKCKKVSIAIPTSLATHVYASPKIHPLKPIADLGYTITIDAEPANLSILDISLLEKLENEDIRLIRAGLGDILAFYTAVHDWKLAWKNNKSDNNYYVETIIDIIINRLHDVNYNNPLRNWWLQYIEMQVLLCNITDWVGSSPASGSEHLFANCIESISKDDLIHGEMVAIGVVLMSYFQNLNLKYLKEIIDNIGISLSLSENNISVSDIYNAFKESELLGRKKNRFTFLETTSISKKQIEESINILNNRYGFNLSPNH